MVSRRIYAERSTPAIAASPEPIAKVMEIVLFTLIPINWAAPLSSDTASIACPVFCLADKGKIRYDQDTTDNGYDGYTSDHDRNIQVSGLQSYELFCISHWLAQSKDVPS